MFPCSKITRLCGILLPGKSTSNANLALGSGRRRDDVGGFGCGFAPRLPRKRHRGSATGVRRVASRLTRLHAASAALRFLWTSDSDSGIVGGMTTEDQANAATSGALALQFWREVRGRETEAHRRGHQWGGSTEPRSAPAAIATGSQVTQNMCFCETNRIAMLANSAVTCSEAICYDYGCENLNPVRLAKPNAFWRGRGGTNEDCGRMACAVGPRKGSG
jgi:hypothetical protein